MSIKKNINIFWLKKNPHLIWSYGANWKIRKFPKNILKIFVFELFKRIINEFESAMVNKPLVFQVIKVLLYMIIQYERQVNLFTFFFTAFLLKQSSLVHVFCFFFSFLWSSVQTAYVPKTPFSHDSAYIIEPWNRNAYSLPYDLRREQQILISGQSASKVKI